MPAVEEIEEVNARFAEADSADAFMRVAASLLREYTNRKDKKVQMNHLVLRMERGFVERAPPGDSQRVRRRWWRPSRGARRSGPGVGVGRAAAPGNRWWGLDGRAVRVARRPRDTEGVEGRV